MGRITRLYESLQKKRQKLDAVMPRELQDKALMGGAGEMADIFGVQAGGVMIAAGILLIILDLVIAPLCLLFMSNHSPIWLYGGSIFAASLGLIWSGKYLVATCARNLKETAAQTAQTAKNLWAMKNKDDAEHPPSQEK